MLYRQYFDKIAGSRLDRLGDRGGGEGEVHAYYKYYLCAILLKF